MKDENIRLRHVDTAALTLWKVSIPWRVGFKERLTSEMRRRHHQRVFSDMPDREHVPIIVRPLVPVSVHEQ
jgi:hypothetical protein